MIDRRGIAKQLQDVIDPELGVNIVDLGLVYSIRVEGQTIKIEYTATTPGCPMRRYLQREIEKALQSVIQIEDGLTDFAAELVWEPTWNVDMIISGVEFFAQPPPRAQINS